MSVACASNDHQSIKDKTVDFETFNRTGSWATGDGKFNEPTPFSFYLRVMVNGTHRFGEQSLCSQSLKTSATNSSDHKKLSEPFRGIALQEMVNRNAQIDVESDMLFAMILNVKDVPASLSRGAPTSFCLVKSKVETGEKFLPPEIQRNMEEFGSFPPQKDEPIFNSEKLYFVTPEYLREMIEKEIRHYMQLMVPTLNGEIEDKCGYFTIDPEDECANYYQSELRQQKNKLGCSKDEKETEEIQARIKEIEEKQVVFPPKPLRAGITYSDIGVCK